MLCYCEENTQCSDTEAVCEHGINVLGGKQSDKNVILGGQNVLFGMLQGNWR